MNEIELINKIYQRFWNTKNLFLPLLSCSTIFYTNNVIVYVDVFSEYKENWYKQFIIK